MDGLTYPCAKCAEEVAEVLCRLGSPWCHECRTESPHSPIEDSALREDNRRLLVCARNLLDHNRELMARLALTTERRAAA